MSRAILRIPRAAALLWLLVAVAACGGRNEKEKAPAASPGAPSNAPAPAPTPAPGGGEPIKIKGTDGKRVAELTVSGQDVTIELGDEGAGRLIVGRMRETGKRKYGTESGSPIAEVKDDGDAFKVRTPDGKLLWKVKLKDDKIKISDNEENAHPYVLKADEDGVKVKEDEETEIGKVKFHTDEEKVKVKDAAGAEAFMSRTTKRSAMYGVLLMKRIPETERAIIMAEILLRGR